MFRRFTGLLAAFLIFVPVFAVAQTITKLNTPPLTALTSPSAHRRNCGWPRRKRNGLVKLTPDNTGSYVNGTWTTDGEPCPRTIRRSILRPRFWRTDASSSPAANTISENLLSPTSVQSTIRRRTNGSDRNLPKDGDSSAILRQWCCRTANLSGENSTKTLFYAGSCVAEWTEFRRQGKNDTTPKRAGH